MNADFLLDGVVVGSMRPRNPMFTLKVLSRRTADRLVKSWKSIAG